VPIYLGAFTGNILADYPQGSLLAGRIHKIKPAFSHEKPDLFVLRKP
jgi:hypothetical protein